MKADSIDKYSNAASEAAQQRLREMPTCRRKAARGAEGGIKRGQPAAFRNHISLYPTPSVMNRFASELTESKTSSSTLQFPLEKPLPLALIKIIAECRVRESIEKDVKWK